MMADVGNSSSRSCTAFLATFSVLLGLGILAGCGGEEDKGPTDPNKDPLYQTKAYLTTDAKLDQGGRPQLHVGPNPRGASQRLILYRDSEGGVNSVDLTAPFDPAQGLVPSPTRWFAQTNTKYDDPAAGTRWLVVATNYVVWQSAENQIAFWNRAIDPPRPAEAKGARGDIFASMCLVNVDNRAAVVYGNRQGNLVIQDLSDESRRDNDNPFYNPLELRRIEAMLCSAERREVIVAAKPAVNALPGTPSTVEAFAFDTEPGPRIKRPFGRAGGANPTGSYDQIPGTVHTIAASAKYIIVVNELNQIFLIERTSGNLKLISDRTTQTDPVRNVHLNGDFVAWSDNADAGLVGPDYVNVYVVDLSRPLASGAFDIQQLTNDNRVQRDPIIDADTRTVYWLEKADTTKNPGATWQLFMKKLPPPRELTTP